MSIIIYTTPDSIYCRKAKALLEEEGLEYTEIDVSKSLEMAEEMIDKSRQIGVPVFDINGHIIVGFDQQNLRRQILKLIHSVVSNSNTPSSKKKTRRSQ